MDNVKHTMIQKCFARCGFSKATCTCTDQEEDTVIDSNLRKCFHGKLGRIDQELATTGQLRITGKQTSWKGPKETHLVMTRWMKKMKN